MKSFATPPPDVVQVMSAVMILLGFETSWKSVKKVLGNTMPFINSLKSFDCENVSAKKLNELKKYTKSESFNVSYLNRISLAAGVFCRWVLAIESYCEAL